MKRLTLIRHAKSSWSDPELQDRDRPLNPRGLRNAPLMGRLLKERDLIPDCILSSPALRARMTAERLGLLANDRGLLIDDRLYEHGLAGLYAAIDELEEDLKHVALIGHNPDFTRFLNELADETLQNLPTCGVASIVFEVDSWRHILAGSGRLTHYDYPKRHAEES